MAINRANRDEILNNRKWEAEQIKALGICDAGNTVRLGIGAITTDRIKAYYDLCGNSKVREPGSMDFNTIAVLSFANKGVGFDVRKALTGKYEVDRLYDALPGHHCTFELIKL